MTEPLQFQQTPWADYSGMMSSTGVDSRCAPWFQQGQHPSLGSGCSWVPPWVEASEQAILDTHSAAVMNGAEAGQQLLSLVSTGDGWGGKTDLEECRTLQPWQPEDNCQRDSEDPTDESTTCSMSSPMNNHVALEDMPDIAGPWDQFELNEARFGVKTSFNEDLSQYTVDLQLSKIPTAVRHKAERIAAEIENEHKASGRLHGDAYNCTAVVDGQPDEEEQFSAVSHQLQDVPMQ